MASIYDWSTTAANNGTSDADVPWPEGMARRQVNDSARGIMKRNAELLGDIGGALSAGGTANGLTVTANSNFTTYADGRIISFRATADNTGAATLSVNGIGAKAIRKMDTTGDVALVAGDIQATGLYVAQYSTALNGSAGAWLLVNPTLPINLLTTGAASSTDNAVVRFDGTTGKVIQNSGVIIDDSNNVSGITSIAGNVTASGNWTFNNGSGDTPSITVNTGLIPNIALITGSEGGLQIYNGANGSASAVMAFHRGGSHAGYFGLDTDNVFKIGGWSYGANAYPVILGNFSNAANLTVTGSVTSGQVFTSSATSAILSTGSAGIVYLRPNGAASGTGQVYVDSAGNLVGSAGTYGATVYASAGGGFKITSDPSTGFASTAGGEMEFYSSGVFRHKFSASSILSGTTTFNPAAVGSGISTGGQAFMTVDNNSCIILNRLSTFGVIVNLRSNNTTIGTISYESDGLTHYNTTSDEALKNFVGPYDPQKAIEIIRADPVREFEWKANGTRAVGWGAQTSYAVSKDLASPGHGNPGDEDYAPWGVDMSKRTTHLWAALSAALDMIDDLKARVAALEAA